MLAEAQDHILEGGAGDDLLSGGPLSELLDFRAGEAGRDRVAEFEIWDRLQFTGFGVAYGTDPRQHLRQTEIDVLSDQKGVVVELSGLQLDELQDDNILL